MRCIIIPYCNSIKRITQRSTESLRIRGGRVVVINTIGIMFPHGFALVYNLRAIIVHSNCLHGYVLRSWPGTEKIEAVSRGIFNPGSGGIVSRLFLGESGARASRTRSSQSRKVPPLQPEALRAGGPHLPCYQHDTWVIPQCQRSCRSILYLYCLRRESRAKSPPQQRTASCRKV